MQDIRIKNISKAYGDKQVLNHISKEFPSGETTVIMGASGCGKTTLLRILLGLEKADSGEVTGMPERVAVLFQEDRLCEDVSAYENIALVLERKKTHAQRDAQKCRIEQEAAQVGITADDLKQNVMELSGGMRRRIALLRALLYDVECVILDEPFNFLNEETADRLRSWLKRYCKEGNTVLITSDNYPDVADICTKLSVLKNRKLLRTDINPAVFHQQKFLTVKGENKIEASQNQWKDCLLRLIYEEDGETGYLFEGTADKLVLLLNCLLYTSPSPRDA